MRFPKIKTHPSMLLNVLYCTRKTSRFSARSKRNFVTRVRQFRNNEIFSDISPSQRRNFSPRRIVHWFRVSRAYDYRYAFYTKNVAAMSKFRVIPNDLSFLFFNATFYINNSLFLSASISLFSKSFHSEKEKQLLFLIFFPYF